MSVTATTAKLLAGTTFEIENPDSPGTWVDVPEVTDIGTAGAQGSFVETTPIDITTGQRTYISGLSDPQENTVTMNWIANTVQEQVRTWAEARRAVQIRIKFKSVKTATFNAGLSGFMTAPANDPNSPIRATFSYRQSGSVVWS